MKRTYTIAAVPQDEVKGRVAVVNLEPMTLSMAETMAKLYDAKYKHLLSRHKFSHMVAFNLEALTHEIPFDMLYES